MGVGLLNKVERDELLSVLPSAIRPLVLAEWARQVRSGSEMFNAFIRADRWLGQVVQLPDALRGIGLDATDEEICGLADAAVKSFMQYERIGYGLPGLLKKAVNDYGLDLSVFDGKEPEGILGRLKNEKFWRGQLRRSIARKTENLMREVGGVSRKTGLYVSNDGLRRRKSQKARNAGLLAHMVAVNELGQEFTLDELSALGVSNPAIRRAELMVRIRGFEESCSSLSHFAVLQYLNGKPLFYKGFPFYLVCKIGLKIIIVGRNLPFFLGFSALPTAVSWWHIAFLLLPNSGLNLLAVGLHTACCGVFATNHGL